jgi:hypothetical protein
VYRAWLSWRSPERFSRTRTVWQRKPGSARPAEHGEGGVGAAAARMGPGAHHGGGHNRAHSGAGKQVGSPSPHQPQDGLAVVGGLGGQLPDPTGQARQGRSRGRGLNVPAGLDTQPGAGGHELAGRAAPEPFLQDLGCGDDQRVQLALGVAGGLDRRAAGGQPHRQRRPWAGRSGLASWLIRQGLRGGTGLRQRPLDGASTRASSTVPSGVARAY